MKTTLSIEQSARLIELGVDANLASKTIVTDDYNEEWENFQHPIFDLSDLLSILPKGIIYNGLTIKFRITSWYDEPYFVGYVNQINEYITPNKEPFSAPELIDALYQLLIWCLEQGCCKCGNGGGR